MSRDGRYLPKCRSNFGRRGGSPRQYSEPGNAGAVARGAEDHLSTIRKPEEMQDDCMDVGSRATQERLPGARRSPRAKTVQEQLQGLRTITSDGVRSQEQLQDLRTITSA